MLVTGDRGLAGAFNSQILRAGIRTEEGKLKEADADLDRAAALRLDRATAYALHNARASVELTRKRWPLAERQAEEAIRRSEYLYRTVASNIPSGAVALFDRELRYVVVDGGGVLDAAITAWTEQHNAEAVAETLQVADVAAYPVVTMAGLFADPQLAARRQFRVRR